MNDENQYHLKLTVISKLPAWKFSDGLQGLWDNNGIDGQYDLNVSDDQIGITISRQIADDANLIHARLPQDINEISVINAAASQIIHELTIKEPEGVISGEYDQIIDALMNGKFETINISELVGAELEARNQIGQLFNSFIDATKDLITHASQIDHAQGLVSVDGGVFVKMAQSLSDFTKHKGVISNYGKFDGHPIHAAWAVFDSRKHVPENDVFTIDFNLIDKLSSSIVAYNEAKEKYKNDKESSEMSS